MSVRNFLILLAVTALFVAAAFIAVLQRDRTVDPTVAERRVFPELASRLDDLAWIRIEHGAMAADLGSVAGQWTIVEKGNYPVMAGKVRRLLIGLADLTLIEPKTSRPDLYGRLGLGDPRLGKSSLVTLQDRTGATLAALLIGNSRPDRLGGGNDGVYVRKPGDKQTWLARGSLDLPEKLTDWLDRAIIDLPANRIASVTLAEGDSGPLVLFRDSPGKPFAVGNPPPGARFKEEAVGAPAGALSALQLQDVRPAADLPLPREGVASAAFATFDGLVVTAQLFADGSGDWLRLAAIGGGKAADEAAAIQRRTGRWVYAIPRERAKLLRTRLADLTAAEKGS